MNLTHDKLVKRLAEVLGKEEEWVVSELSKIVEEIREATNKGEVYSIEKFGSFSIKDGKLVFDVDEVFALEINYKYAGMSPIEMEAPSHQSYEEFVKEDPVAKDGPGTEEIEKEVTPEKPEKPEEEKVKEEIKDTSDSEKKNLPFQSGSPLDKLISGQKKQPDTKETSQIDVSKGPHKTQEAIKKANTGKTKIPERRKSTVKSSATKVLPKKPVTRKSPKKAKTSNGSLITIGIIVMLCVVAGAVAVLIEKNASLVKQAYKTEHLMPGSSSTQNVASQNKSASAVASDQNSQGSANADTAQINNSGVLGNTQKKSDVKVANKIMSELSASNPYGLKGVVKPKISDFFTIVVYSLINQDQADSQKSKLDKRGFRTVVTKADVDGTYVWRVGLGQFPSVQDAEQAAEKLPAPFNTKHFIKRVQIQ